MGDHRPPERKANKRPLPTDCQPAIMIRSAALLLQRSCLSASQTQKNEDSLIDASIHQPRVPRYGDLTYFSARS